MATDATTDLDSITSPSSDSPTPIRYAFRNPRTKEEAIAPDRLKYLQEESIVIPLPTVTVHQAMKDFKRERFVYNCI